MDQRRRGISKPIAEAIGSTPYLGATPRRINPPFFWWYSSHHETRPLAFGSTSRVWVLKLKYNNPGNVQKPGRTMRDRCSPVFPPSPQPVMRLSKCGVLLPIVWRARANLRCRDTHLRQLTAFQNRPLPKVRPGSNCPECGTWFFAQSLTFGTRQNGVSR